MLPAHCDVSTCDGAFGRRRRARFQGRAGLVGACLCPVRLAWPCGGQVGKAGAPTTGLVARSGNSILGVKEASERASNPCCQPAFSGH